MSVNQTKLIGLSGTGPDNHYLADANVPLNETPWTLGLFLQCIALVSDIEGPEPVFSTLSGNTGIRVTRTGSEVTFSVTVGEGVGVETFTIPIHPSTVVAGGLFLHLSHDGEGAITQYLQGQLVGTFNLAAPMVQGVAPRLGSAIGSTVVNNATAILAAGVTGAFDVDTAENDVARAMTFHTFRPANYAHLWSFQSDGVRDIPSVLRDVGVLSEPPILAGIPMSRVGLGGLTRNIFDVQFASPLLTGG